MGKHKPARLRRAKKKAAQRKAYRARKKERDNAQGRRESKGVSV